MFCLIKIYKEKKSLKCFCLSLIIFSILSVPSNISAAESDRVVIGPISVLGEISVPEQQILFNYFREQINQRYSLVSHKVLEMIAEQGLSSIDIEDCRDSECVRKVQNFISNLRTQFKTDELFLFGLVKSDEEIQLSLKLSSLSAPEVTQIIVSQTCGKCGIVALMAEVDMLVQRMLQRIVEEKFIQPEEEIASPDEKIPPVSEEPSDLLPEPTPPDPYVVARDAYNEQIGELLINVTYSLQVFRSGMFVQLEVSIDTEGNVVGQKIVKTSGSQDYDQTAIMNVQDVQFDPLPEIMRQFGNYVVIVQIQNSR